MEQKLCCIEENVACEIYSISGPNKCRLLELGFTRGTIVKIVRKSIFSGPIEVQVRNSKVAIRNDEAENILVIVK